MRTTRSVTAMLIVATTAGTAGVVAALIVGSEIGRAVMAGM